MITRTAWQSRPIPKEVIEEKCRRYRQHSRKILPRTELINDSDFTTMALFQAEFRVLVEYYRLAYNLHRLTTLDGVMEQSLTKTLAVKETPDIRTQGLQTLPGNLPDEWENLQGASSHH